MKTSRVPVSFPYSNGESRCQFSTSSRPSRSSVPTYWPLPKAVANPRPTWNTIVHGRGGRTRKRKVRLLRRPPASLPCFPFFPWSNFLPVRAADSPTANLPVNLIAALRLGVSFTVLSGRGQTLARLDGRCHAVVHASDLRAPHAKPRSRKRDAKANGDHLFE